MDSRPIKLMARATGSPSFEREISIAAWGFCPGHLRMNLFHPDGNAMIVECQATMIRLGFCAHSALACSSPSNVHRMVRPQSAI